MTIVLVRVSVAVMKFYDQSNVKRKGFIWFAQPDHISSLRMEHKAGT